MKVTSLMSAVAALVATASAFLVTPDMVPKPFNPSKDWSTLNNWNPTENTLDVPCHDCPFLADDASTPGKVQLLDVKNSIHLKFDTEGNNLLVNGVAVYPWEGRAPVVTAHQVAAGQEQAGYEERISFIVKVARKFKVHGGYHRSKYGRAGPQDNLDQIDIEFTILDLAGIPVKTPSIKVGLIGVLEPIETMEAGMLIHIIETKPYDPQQDRCDNAHNPSMCRVAAMFGERLREIVQDAKNRAAGMKTWLKKPEHKPGMKPCKGRPFRIGGLPPPPSGPSGSRPGGRHPEHGHGHVPHHHHHHHHSALARMIHRFMRTLVMPALLGIVGGLAASALGMMVGQFISYLWFKFGRGGQRGDVENVRVYEVEVAEGEKVAHLVDEEADLVIEVPPPKYEEAGN